MNPQHKKIAGIILGCFVVILFIRGCGGPKEGEETKEGASSAIFIATEEDGYSEDWTDSSRHLEYSILANQVVILAVSDYTPDKNYIATLRIKDAKGKTVYTSKEISFQPSDPDWYIRWGFTPNYKSQKYGKWRYEADIKGYGKVRQDIKILQPSESQKENLAYAEKARDAMFRAFANFWLGLDNDTFITQLTNHKEIGLFQIAGLDHEVFRDIVSKADKLNGINYRGRIRFRFESWRIFKITDQDGGWSKWVDVERPRNQAENVFQNEFSDIFRMLGKYANAGEYFETPFSPGLLYEVYEQDGNWYVRSDIRNRLYINGELNSKLKPDMIQEFPSPGNLGGAILKSPPGNEARKLAEKSLTPRDAAKMIADSIKRNPKATKGDVEKTMRRIR